MTEMQRISEWPRKNAELEVRIRELESQLADKQAIIDMLFEHNPDGVLVSDAAGTFKMNAAATAMMRNNVTEQKREEWTTSYGFFRTDKVTPIPTEELPLARTLARGEIIEEEVLWIVSESRPEGMYLATSVRPLPGGGAVLTSRDVTEKRQLAENLAQRNEQLAAREEENRELIARLRVAVDELSTPVLEIWDDILALPVVGIVDTQRSAHMTERLLAEVVRSRARHVIVDLTGVELIDTSTADRFLKLARSVQLLGARCVVTGIQPAVAQTLVELGIEFATLETHRNLKNALETCIRRNLMDSKAGAR
jgi:rsbT co-antagonist protein RsbR